MGEEIENKNYFLQKKEKIISWLKDPYNIILLIILLSAFFIHLYYFFITANQPLWWDELCYGSLAKNFITHSWNNTPLIITESHIRPLLFPFLWAFLMIFNIGEVANRFFLAFLPSAISVFFVYLVGKEIFNKKAGLIAAAIFSVFWLNLFYSSRFLVHMLAMAFLLSSIYYFIKTTKEREGINMKNLCISLILLSFATLTRYQDGMIFFIYLVVLIFAKKLYLNRKKFWYAGIVGLLPLLLFFVINLITQGNIFPALLLGDYVKPASENGVIAPFAFNILNYIPSFLTTTFFIFFMIGLAYIIFEIILGYNLITSNQKLRNSFMLLLLLIVFLSFFIFFTRGAEDRWLFEILISLAVIAGYGISICSDLISKYSKPLSIILIICVLIFGAYSQISYADPLIMQKKESYLQMKEAFEWIKYNTPEQAIIVGNGIEPYAVYYSDRPYSLFMSNETDAHKILSSDYLVIHGFTPQPDYLIEYTKDNNQTLKPIHVEFFQNQPIVIVYEILKTNISMQK